MTTADTSSVTVAIASVFLASICSSRASNPNRQPQLQRRRVLGSHYGESLRHFEGPWAIVADPETPIVSSCSRPRRNSTAILRVRLQ